MPTECHAIDYQPNSVHIFNNIEDEESNCREERHRDTAKLSIVICPTNSLSQHNNTFTIYYFPLRVCVCVRALLLYVICVLAVTFYDHIINEAKRQDARFSNRFLFFHSFEIMLV